MTIFILWSQGRCLPLSLPLSYLMLLDSNDSNSVTEHRSYRILPRHYINILLKYFPKNVALANAIAAWKGNVFLNEWMTYICRDSYLGYVFPLPFLLLSSAQHFLPYPCYSPPVHHPGLSYLFPTHTCSPVPVPVPISSWSCLYLFLWFSPLGSFLPACLPFPLWICLSYLDCLPIDKLQACLLNFVIQALVIQPFNLWCLHLSPPHVCPVPSFMTKFYKPLWGQGGWSGWIGGLQLQDVHWFTFSFHHASLRVLGNLLLFHPYLYIKNMQIFIYFMF